MIRSQSPRGGATPPERRRLRIRISLRALMAFVVVCGCILALVVHRLRVKAAEAAYEHARLSREVTEMALAEFTQAVAKRDVEVVDAEISLAGAHLKFAQETLAESRLQAEMMNVTKPEFAENERAIRRAELQLRVAQTKKMNVETKNLRTIDELKSESEKARVVELAKKAIYTQAKSRWMSKLIW
jgi:hypothetical protein